MVSMSHLLVDSQQLMLLSPDLEALNTAGDQTVTLGLAGLDTADKPSLPLVSLPLVMLLPLV